MPEKKIVQRKVVWMQLPGLPMEFWEPLMLIEIASKVGKPVALDNFTSRHRKAGFMRLLLELNSTDPLKPGVSIQSGDAVF